LIKSKGKMVLILSLAFLLLLLSNQEAPAFEYYADSVPGPLKGKCEVCHSGSGLDPFGLDFKSVPDHSSNPSQAIQSIGNVDSDKDGFTNLEELRAGTYPGDPASYPEYSRNVPFPLVPVGIISIAFLFVVAVVLFVNKKLQDQDFQIEREKRI